MTDSGDNGSALAGAPAIPDHDLLAKIGGGSYGEVWLARSATGVYRAIKVLWRSRFGLDQQPFEREFEGLQRFEPVSRSHAHVVDILHIGRHEEVLYYVMELADGANGQRPGEGGCEVDIYVPDTLSGRIREQGRFPIVECLEIARALSLALDHLHSNGLIHRDVKPSNVVFVEGVLKLADVGLVSATDATVSLVGTEGFIPPEGPGTVQADLFGLGKILYEISSGLDRMEYPSVPEWVGKDGVDRPWSEFNEIVLKCCEKDVRRRYGSTREVLADLALLEEGGSLVKRRRRSAVWRSAKRAVLAGAGCAGLVALGAMLSRDRELAPQREVRRQLAGTPLELSEIKLPFNRHRHREWDLSPDGKELAVTSRGTVLVWSRLREIEVPVLAENPEGWELRNPRWTGRGRKLVCLGRRETEIGRKEAILLIDAGRRAIERTVHETSGSLSTMSLSRRSRTIAVAAWGDKEKPHGLLGIGLDDGRPRVWAEGGGDGVGDLSPDGKWLALWPKRSERGEEKERNLWLFSPQDGRRVQVTRGGFAAHATWSLDGRALYYVAGDSFDEDSTLNLWKVEVDPDSGEPVGEPRQITRFEDAQVHFPQVLGNGKILIGLTNESIRVWTAPTDAPERLQHVVTGTRSKLSRDGEWIYYLIRKLGREGTHRIPNGGGEARRLTTTVPYGFDVSPSGNQLAVADAQTGHGAIRVIDAETGAVREVASISGERGASVAWSPNGERLAYTDGPALFVVGRDGSALRRLATIEDWHEEAFEGSIGWSPDGTMIAGIGYGDAVAKSEDWNQVYVVEVDGGKLRCVTPGEAMFNKEGLRWHPEGGRLSYTAYGIGPEGSQIRWAYPDGRPSTLLVDHPDHWDWVGTWHPGGREFYFHAYGGAEGDSSCHVLDLDTREAAHCKAPLENSFLLPQWSDEGRVVMWTTHTATYQLQIIEGE